MTLRPLLSAREPSDFADWFRAGIEYTLRVARTLDWPVGDLPAHRDRGVAAMRAGDTDPEPAVAATIAGTLLGDAAFGRPFLRYTPRWYRLALAGPIRLAERRLAAVAAPYADRAREAGYTVERPTFTTPSEVVVDGTALSATLDELGFADRFLLADAILHVEWLRDVAAICGLSVPTDLLARTIRESAVHYGRRGDDHDAALSPETRRVQRALFGDDAWVRDVNVTYRLQSTLLSVWEGILRRERRRLATASE